MLGPPSLVGGTGVERSMAVAVQIRENLVCLSIREPPTGTCRTPRRATGSRRTPRPSKNDDMSPVNHISYAYARARPGAAIAAAGFLGIAAVALAAVLLLWLLMPETNPSNRNEHLQPSG